MKYLLLEHCTDGSGVYPRITVHDTPEAREKATLDAIYGDAMGMDGYEEEAAKYLAELREDGEIAFEGDPGLSWITCEELALPNAKISNAEPKT